MKNLLTETAEILLQCKKVKDDVRWVGVRYAGVGREDTGLSFTWEQFSAVANLEYDNGFGGNEVEGSLVVVGDDWWLERGEYDGSEWWEFKTMPTKPPSGMPTKDIIFTDRY